MFNGRNTDMKHYEVIVVGAGPAGSTAAKHLAEKKVPVLLIDKAKFPRDKSCAGGLPLRVIKQFPYIAELNLIESYSYAANGYYVTPTSKIMFKEKDPIAAMVLRKKFDYGLVQHAIDQGASFMQGKKVVDLKITKDKGLVVLDDGSTIQSKIIIGADGVWSTVAKKSGLLHANHPFTICAFREFRVKKEVISSYFGDEHQMHIFLAFNNMKGYGWVFPKKNHIHVGIGEFSVSEDDSQKKINIKNMYKSFIKTLQDQHIIPKTCSHQPMHGSALPLRPLHKTYADHIILCGDAAGYINPISGEGIYFALTSGKIAAEVAVQALNQNDPSENVLSHYEKLFWKNDVGKDLKTLIHASDLWIKNTNRFFQAGISDKQLSEMVIKLLTGKESVHHMRNKIMRRYLFVLIKNFLFKSTTN